MGRRTNIKSFQKEIILRSSLVLFSSFMFLNTYVPYKKGKDHHKEGGLGEKQKKKELLKELETKGNLVGQRKG